MVLSFWWAMFIFTNLLVAVSYLISVEGSNCFTMNPFSKTVSPFLTMVYGCLEVSWFSGNSRKKVTERTADEKKKAYS